MIIVCYRQSYLRVNWFIGVTYQIANLIDWVIKVSTLAIKKTTTDNRIVWEATVTEEYNNETICYHINDYGQSVSLQRLYYSTRVILDVQTCEWNILPAMKAAVLSHVRIFNYCILCAMTASLALICFASNKFHSTPVRNAH